MTLYLVSWITHSRANIDNHESRLKSVHVLCGERHVMCVRGGDACDFTVQYSSITQTAVIVTVSVI